MHSLRQEGEPRSLRGEAVLKEKYSSKKPLHILNFLNIHRTERHEALYGLKYKPNKQDALVALEDAKAFVREIEKLKVVEDK